MNPADPDSARHSSTGRTIAGRYNGDKRNNTTQLYSPLLRDLKDVRHAERDSMTDPLVIAIVVAIMTPHSRTKSWFSS